MGSCSLGTFYKQESLIFLPVYACNIGCLSMSFLLQIDIESFW
jgi:hypothetical protein